MGAVSHDSLRSLLQAAEVVAFGVVALHLERPTDGSSRALRSSDPANSRPTVGL